MRWSTWIMGLVAIGLTAGCGDGGSSNDVDAGPDTDTDVDSDTDGDTDTDSDTDTQCADMLNFSPCEIITEPDRSYDICIDGYCRSPGCGSFECNPPGPHFPLPDTGQALCYGGTLDSMECPGTAGDAVCADAPYCGQDAQYGWDVSHVATNRFTRTEEVSGEPIAIDNVTGIIWQAAPSSDVNIQWNAALTFCDSLLWAGFDDWRLPDIFELTSIMGLGRADPAVDETIFDFITFSGYWSSSYAGLDSTESYERAFEGLFLWGESSVSGFGNPKRVVCVRGEPTPQPIARFTRSEPVEGETIVTDGTTGLEWQGCMAGQTGADCAGEADPTSWPDALSYCESLALGGADDWRLPDRVELFSIADTQQETPGISLDAFPGAMSFGVWSSTTYIGAWDPGDPEEQDTDPVRAWTMDYWEDTTRSAAKANDLAVALGVRCVRGGQ
ncbi:MAG: DUF1566 domain-containing protein [Proteobacteria bacterium]|jgi:hypothetical protein|nr:DUF1566 domain-containing protein [Pseudomonadota bacterium]